MARYLIVIDMQKDFIDGSLGTPEAVAIVDSVNQMVAAWDGPVIFTRDTHEADYMETQEGRNLPVVHCIRNTDGWQLETGLQALCDARESRIFDKPAFGSMELSAYLAEKHVEEFIDEIVLVGLCTDICVISNAMLAKAALPEVPVTVIADCCAGVTPVSHERALEAMKMCQIIIRQAHKVQIQ